MDRNDAKGTVIPEDGSASEVKNRLLEALEQPHLPSGVPSDL
jgi:hypothetical protein